MLHSRSRDEIRLIADEMRYLLMLQSFCIAIHWLTWYKFVSHFIFFDYILSAIIAIIHRHYYSHLLITNTSVYSSMYIRTFSCLRARFLLINCLQITCFLILITQIMREFSPNCVLDPLIETLLASPRN